MTFGNQKPVPADFFATFPDTATLQDAEVRETLDRWRRQGVQSMRATITGPKAVDDQTGYPPGLWLEGWRERYAKQLPFGESAELGGPVFPPLVAGVDS